MCIRDSNVAFDPRVIIEDGVCKLADRSALAGSVATMDRLIRTLVQKAEIPLEYADRRASETPSRIMGVYAVSYTHLDVYKRQIYRCV